MSKIKRLSSTFLTILILLSTQAVDALPTGNNPYNDNQGLRYKDDILFVDDSCGDVETSASGSGGGSVSESSDPDKREQAVWDYFRGQGLNEAETAGIMGNMSQESGFDPTRAQVGGDTKDPSVFGNAVGGGKAWGLIQWDEGGRAIDYAKQAKITTPIYEMKTQLDLIWWHLNNSSPTGKQNALPEYKQRSSVGSTDDDKAISAASAWENLMEGAGNPQMANRWAAAKGAIHKHKNDSVHLSDGSPAVTTTSSVDGCECSASGGSPDASATGKTVVLDPGHSKNSIYETEEGITAEDYNNPTTEMQDAFDVASKVQTELTKKGYNVIMTKTREDDTVGLIKRAKIANDAHADIAVSIHSSPGPFGSASTGWVTPQRVGGYRQSGINKKTFTDADIATKSQKYADDMLSARKAVEGDVAIHDINFNLRGLPATGDLPISMLFATVPWVYNEVGQSGFDGDKYAEGITKGIENALGDSGGTPSVSGSATATPSDGSCSSDGAVGGDFQATIKNYAWSTYRGQGFITPKPAYAKAVEKARSEGRYVGGTKYPGIDCGGFVGLAMYDSGYEPHYNSDDKGGYTGSVSEPRSQWGWLDKNWDKVKPKNGHSQLTTGDLEPGDVAIGPGHTFMYVGHIDGFKDVFASASWDGRAPMAGQGDAMSGKYTYYRKR